MVRGDLFGEDGRKNQNNEKDKDGKDRQSPGLSPIAGGSGLLRLGAFSLGLSLHDNWRRAGAVFGCHILGSPVQAVRL
jgi:hypothetical protein